MDRFPLRPFYGDTAKHGGVSFSFSGFLFSEGLPFFLLAGGLFPAPTLLPVAVTLLCLPALLRPLRRKKRPAAEGTPPSLGLLRGGSLPFPRGASLLLLWAALLALSALGGGGEGLLRALLALSALAVARTAEEHSLQAGAVAAALAGALAIGEKLLGRAALGWMDAARFSDLGGRAAFPFGNPNLLSAFLLLGLPLCLATAEQRPPLGGVLSLLTLGGILATLSRTAMLGAGCLFLLWMLRRAKHPSRAMAVAVLAASLLPSALWRRALSVFSPADTSGLYRLRLWQSLLRLPPEAALFGLGAGRRALFSALAPVMSAGLEKAEHTHSLYLGLLFSAGVGGLVAFLLLGGSILRSLLRQRDGAAWAVSHALLGALFLGLSDDLFYDRRLFLWVLWLLGLGLFLKNKEEHV